MLRNAPTDAKGSITAKRKFAFVLANNFWISMALIIIKMRRKREPKLNIFTFSAIKGTVLTALYKRDHTHETLTMSLSSFSARWSMHSCESEMSFFSKVIQGDLALSAESGISKSSS